MGDYVDTEACAPEAEGVPDLNPVRRLVRPGQWGVSAPCSTEDFKVNGQKQKPLAKDWTHRLSPESRSRTGSSLKAAFKHLQNPDAISLGGGLPLSEFFPFETLSYTSIFASNNKNSDTTISHKGCALQAGKNDIADAKGSGSPQLLRWITEHTEIVHDPPYRDWQCTMTIGNTSALDMALRMLTRTGDYVLSDNYTFATAVETALPMGVKFTGVDMDGEGLLPKSLRDVLDDWDPEKHGGARKPGLLYLIHTGQNPTGETRSLQRRKDIYQVAQEHDLIILEDDPYYFLQMDAYIPRTAGDVSASETPHLPEDLLKLIVPSYLSIDIDGRIMRMDSFSKVVSPGSRIGWVTAPQAIIERYKNHADVSTQGPSGFSQLAFFKLLDEFWGHIDYMVRACEQYLPRDIVTWEPAQAGMFQWLRVDWEKHPDALTKPLHKIEEQIWEEAIKQGALVARGSWFNANGDNPNKGIFYRTTFAAAPLGKIEEAVKRFGYALRVSFQTV
ncbi:aromatic aminotransferase [Colletotrichum incanum]|nr:aromatic aminotransferase [Colletotrichum incanum]